MYTGQGITASQRKGGSTADPRFTLSRYIPSLQTPPSQHELIGLIGGFDITLPPHSSKPRRRLIFDPSSTIISPKDHSIPFRLNKTTYRSIYTAPTAPYPPGTEVLLHTPEILLETCTSNIALHIPGEQGQAEWVTPKLSGRAAFLSGTVRAELLERGVIREGEVTVEDWERCRREKRGVVGFNGFV